MVAYTLNRKTEKTCLRGNVNGVGMHAHYFEILTGLRCVSRLDTNLSPYY